MPTSSNSLIFVHSSCDVVYTEDKTTSLTVSGVTPFLVMLTISGQPTLSLLRNEQKLSPKLSYKKNSPVISHNIKAPSRRQRSFARTHTFWFWSIVHTDPENAVPENALFLKTGLRVEKSENAALLFSWGLSNMMTPSPRPSTSCLWPLNPTTSHNNNNNGGLHARVRAAEDIEPFLQLTRLVVECESQQQFDLITGPHKRFWFPCTSHFHLLLVVFGFSVYCLFVYSAQA